LQPCLQIKEHESTPQSPCISIFELLKLTSNVKKSYPFRKNGNSTQETPMNLIKKTSRIYLNQQPKNAKIIPHLKT